MHGVKIVIKFLIIGEYRHIGKGLENFKYLIDMWFAIGGGQAVACGFGLFRGLEYDAQASRADVVQFLHVQHRQVQALCNDCLQLLVKAWRGDPYGNLQFSKTARNFNPMMATAGKVTIVEVDELVEPGALDPNFIHTPGIFVHRILEAKCEKRIEQRTVRAS